MANNENICSQESDRPVPARQDALPGPTPTAHPRPAVKPVLCSTALALGGWPAPAPQGWLGSQQRGGASCPALQPRSILQVTDELQSGQESAAGNSVNVCSRSCVVDVNNSIPGTGPTAAAASCVQQRHTAACPGARAGSGLLSRSQLRNRVKDRQHSQAPGRIDARRNAARARLASSCSGPARISRLSRRREAAPADCLAQSTCAGTPSPAPLGEHTSAPCFVARTEELCPRARPAVSAASAPGQPGCQQSASRRVHSHVPMAAEGRAAPSGAAGCGSSEVRQARNAPQWMPCDTGLWSEGGALCMPRAASITLAAEPAQPPPTVAPSPGLAGHCSTSVKWHRTAANTSVDHASVREPPTASGGQQHAKPAAPFAAPIDLLSSSEGTSQVTLHQPCCCSESAEVVLSSSVDCAGNERTSASAGSCVGTNEVRPQRRAIGQHSTLQRTETAAHTAGDPFATGSADALLAELQRTKVVNRAAQHGALAAEVPSERTLAQTQGHIVAWAMGMHSAALAEDARGVARLHAALQPLVPAAAAALAAARMTPALVLRAAEADLRGLHVAAEHVPLVVDVCTALCTDAGALSAAETALLRAPLPPPHTPHAGMARRSGAVATIAGHGGSAMSGDRCATRRPPFVAPLVAALARVLPSAADLALSGDDARQSDGTRSAASRCLAQRSVGTAAAWATSRCKWRVKMRAYVCIEPSSVRSYCRAAERRVWARHKVTAAQRARPATASGRTCGPRGSRGKLQAALVGQRGTRGQLTWHFAAGGGACTQAAADAAVARLLRERRAEAPDVSVDTALLDPTAVYAMNSQGQLCMAS